MKINGTYKYEHKGKLISRQRVNQIRNPEKHLARKFVKAGIELGYFKREPCEICGNVKSEAHHISYTGSFNIKWLCKKHHEEHKIIS
jgi:hypothetical protein